MFPNQNNTGENGEDIYDIRQKNNTVEYGKDMRNPHKQKYNGGVLE